MKPICSKEALVEFKHRYEALSGLSVPMDYLETSKVFVFRKAGKMVGGFILGSKTPLRTAEVFISPANQEIVSNTFSQERCSEVCCFWMERKFRKHPLFNARCWYRMAHEVKRQEKEFVLYGTNSGGLAKMYGYPKKSFLLHQDNVAGKQTYVFIARRRDFLGGVMEIILSKLLKRNRKTTASSKESLRKSMDYELSK